MYEIDPQKACFIMLKARQFEAKSMVEESDPDPNFPGLDTPGSTPPGSNPPGSSPSGDGEAIVLESFAEDAVRQEFSDAVEALNVDERVNLVATAWIGRGDFDKAEWREAVKVAREAYATHASHAASYLIGMPLLSDYLEEGLSLIGYSCVELEAEQLQAEQLQASSA